jgi:hypothetical protein
MLRCVYNPVPIPELHRSYAKTRCGKLVLLHDGEIVARYGRKFKLSHGNQYYTVHFGHIPDINAFDMDTPARPFNMNDGTRKLMASILPQSTLAFSLGEDDNEVTYVIEDTAGNYWCLDASYAGCKALVVEMP